MKLSVIIVSYNEKKYLNEALMSCLNQKCNFEYEIIIGDDGSSDGSIEDIKKYVNAYDQVSNFFVMERVEKEDIIPSIRVSNILKKGFELAKGDYICVLSADDYFCDMDKFNSQIAFLEKNEKYASCYTGYKKVWDDGSEKECCQKIPTKHSRNLFWGTSYVHISCFVFRRECIKNLLVRFCDDTGLLYSILATGKSFYMKRICFSYRQRDNSIMHSSKQIELALLEMLLFQDCINKGYMKIASLARFFAPMYMLIKNRKELTRTNYLKYIKQAKKYNNDIIGIVYEFDSYCLLEKAKYILLLLFNGGVYLFFKMIQALSMIVG